MKLPCYYWLFYRSHTIYYLNGLYKIGDMACPVFLHINDAKAKIDEYENRLLDQTINLLNNQNPPNDKTRCSEKIQD